jgi:AcrR family transcriptional regulator
MTQRKAAANRTRLRIVAAARKLLLAEDFSGFTMEAVARAADVSRLTVYYQFRSKAGLLESLYNYIAKRGGMEGLAEVFMHGNVAVPQLHEFIRVFARFWNSDRQVIRRLHALGAIDPEIGKGLRERNERRRKGLTVLLERYSRSYRSLNVSQEATMLDTLHMLTSFETFDALVANGRSEEEVIQIIFKQVHHAIGFFPPVIPPRN